MPVLSSNAFESFALRFVGTAACVWVVAYVESINQSIDHIQASGCAQGTSTSAGVIAVSSLHSPLNPDTSSTRELQFVSIRNNDTMDQQVSIGKISKFTAAGTSTYFPFSALATLHAGETMTYVQSAGFTIYDPLGLPKISKQNT
jgi:hypothetical protein